MKSVCKVYRNPHAAARFTGTVFNWICETPDGETFCNTRETARGVAWQYNQERKLLLQEFEKQQGKANFYEASEES